MGFETSEEVKQFLSNSKILGGVKMFKQVEFEIKYEVIIK